MASKYQTMEEFVEEQAPGTTQPDTGQGGTGKRAVYEPNGSQRCKQIVCTRAWAISTVVVFFLLILAIALIAAFARSGQSQCITAPPPQTPTPIPSVGPTVEAEDHFPWNKVRLPKSVIPLDYEIFLHPNLTTFLFKGRVDITVQVQEPVTFLVLHEKNLNISTYDLLDEIDRKVTIEDTLHHKEQEQVFIMLNEKLDAGKKYTLKLHFEGELTDLMMGFYRSSYTTAKGEKRWLATTQFEPTDARAAFPCFDEPELKATFTLSMVREKRHLSLFNMPRVKMEAYPGGLEVDHFETSVKMSTYLVAFVVCDFRSVHNRTGRGTEVAVYTPPDQLNQANFALEAAVQILEYYEQFFGIPYPLPKQDLIAIPDFAAGAMENWGLITYRTTALLYDPSESSSIHQERVALVVAHELAHQWFGNLVTMKWWNDLWLNEGFATFMEFIGADRVNPAWQQKEQFVTTSLLWALHADGFSNSHPIRSPVRDPTEINEIFDAISYQKGASIIRMLENVIGHDALEMGLQDYLNKYKYGNAETDDLWAALSKVGNLDVKAIMDTWTLQMGYPMLVVTRTSPDRVIAQQKRFLVYQPEKEEHPSPFGYQWQIPLTYVTDRSVRSSSATHWMTNESVSFEISSDARWVKANVDFTGYYRVHYNQENWDALSLQLQQDPKVFSASDRAELIDDAFAMANAGYHKAPVALSLADYLVNEVHYSPWFTALSNYGNMGALLEDEEAYQYYKKYMQKQLDHVIGFLGWEDKGSYLNKLLRNMVLKEAIKVNLKSAVQHTKKIFQSWMVNGTKVPKELKTVVYTAGIQYGGDEEWDFMWKEYKSSQIPSEKKAFLTALTHTPNAATMNRYIHMTLEDDKVRKQDTTMVIGHIALTAPGRILAWRFIKQYWAEFQRRFGGGSFDMDSLIKGSVGGFSTQYDYDEVKAFFEAHKSKVAKRPIAQALESIKINMAWLERNLQDVTEWLRNKATH